jgi:hypothetical protein
MQDWTEYVSTNHRHLYSLCEFKIKLLMPDTSVIFVQLIQRCLDHETENASLEITSRNFLATEREKSGCSETKDGLTLSGRTKSRNG